MIGEVGAMLCGEGEVLQSIGGGIFSVGGGEQCDGERICRFMGGGVTKYWGGRLLF